MRKLLISILLGLSFVSLLPAQDPSGLFPELSVDTTFREKQEFLVNDYFSVGFNYGVSLSRMSFNPSVSQTWRYSPGYASVLFTQHLKLFGYMPYFGFQVGFAYGHEGYKFKMNDETGYMHHIEGAEEAYYNVVEMPVMTYFHYDIDHFKVEVNAGPSVGYRRSITRIGDAVKDSLAHSFKYNDLRWDYGLQGGMGFALVFEPLEFHINALVRYSWSSIYEPNSSDSKYREYYYRFAYPFDVNVTAGVYLQLTRRSGKTNRMLKKEAREAVEQRYRDMKENENASSQYRR